MPELETALRRGINTVTVINNNHSLNQGKRGADRAYEGVDGNAGDLYEFVDVDFAKIARTVGCFGVRVTEPGQIRGALDAALASGKPAVVDVVSDIEGIAAKAWG
jgi:acetolactate synthase-1/2/3 large subunit